MAKPGPKPRIFSDTERAIVQRAAMMNMPQDAIAKLLKTDKETLTKNFREELDCASDKANMAVVGALYKSAMEGNVTAQIFWCKTRLGWRETDRLEVSGQVVKYVIRMPEVASDSKSWQEQHAPQKNIQ